MTWITVTRLPLDQDLAPLSRFLRGRGLEHRISEDNGEQRIEVRDPSAVEPLKELIGEYLAGRVQLPEDAPSSVPSNPGLSPWATPATLLLIGLSVLGWLVVATSTGNRFLPALTFLPFDITSMRFAPQDQGILAGEFWRLLTPAFLHFSLLHLIFNGLWLWEFGRRLELGLGRWHYLSFIVGTAVAANVAQHLWAGPALFGGMSGVVYALVGFIAVRQRLAPHPLYEVPRGILIFMLVWLLLCMSGIVDYFIAGSVANAAHVGGLIAGVIWGAVTARPGRS